MKMACLGLIPCNLRRSQIAHQLISAFVGYMVTVTGAGGLKNVAITVPPVVLPGDTVTLKCHYDLENDQLYMVKWYKGKHEFYRFILKELPHTKVFPLHGIDVDVSKSGASEVVLRDVHFGMAGKYRCEVSADAPNFHTFVVASYMHVVYLPEADPIILTDKQRYGVGDLLHGNCTSAPSHPATNLTWHVNGKKVQESFLQILNVYEVNSKPINKEDMNSHKQITVIGLTLAMEDSLFHYSKARIACEAQLFELYGAQVELILEEDRPCLSSVFSTRESSSHGYSRHWTEPCVSVLTLMLVAALVTR